MITFLSIDFNLIKTDHITITSYLNVKLFLLVNFIKCNKVLLLFLLLFLLRWFCWQFVYLYASWWLWNDRFLAYRGIKKLKLLIIWNLLYQLTIFPISFTYTLFVDEVLSFSWYASVLKLADKLLSIFEKQISFSMLFKILYLTIVNITRRVSDLYFSWKLIVKPVTWEDFTVWQR